MSATTITTNVCLFDLDGTIVNTIVAAESAWTKLCNQHNVNPVDLFKVSHGVKSEETLARFFPNVDNTNGKGASELEKDIADNYLDTIKLIPGAKELLISLDQDPSNSDLNFNADGKRKWAIVTSGSQYLAFSWFKNILKEVGKPTVFVTGEDVTEGKPNPMGYNAAKTELCKILKFDQNTATSVVFEDAPVGIQAGNAMGAITIGIASSYPPEKLIEAGANFVVKDLTHVTVDKNSEDGTVTLKITEPIYQKN